jgi:hypothetical protein
MLSICWVSTALRCYVRSGIVQKAFGLDDWLMLLATVRICGSPTKYYSTIESDPTNFHYFIGVFHHVRSDGYRVRTLWTWET